MVDIDGSLGASDGQAIDAVGTVVVFGPLPSGVYGLEFIPTDGYTGKGDCYALQGDSTVTVTALAGIRIPPETEKTFRVPTNGDRDYVAVVGNGIDTGKARINLWSRVA
ncbi:MAG: hypothetical protein V2A73_16115 [Pseudomonadota bacterium]